MLILKQLDEDLFLIRVKTQIFCLPALSSKRVSDLLLEHRVVLISAVSGLPLRLSHPFEYVLAHPWQYKVCYVSVILKMVFHVMNKYS